jgi:hypothetical protein
MLDHVRSASTYLQTSTNSTHLVDAKISFPNGLTVNWNGSPLGTLKLDEVDVVGDVGATLNTDGDFAVGDVGRLTEFTKVRKRFDLVGFFGWEV